MYRYLPRLIVFLFVISPGFAHSAPSSVLDSCSNGVEPLELITGLSVTPGVAPLSCSSNRSGTMGDGVKACSKHLPSQRTIILAELLASSPILSVKDYWSRMSELVETLGEEKLGDRAQLIFARCLAHFSLTKVEFVPGRAKEAERLVERKLRGDNFPRQQYVFRRLPGMIRRFDGAGERSAIVDKLASLRLARLLESPEFSEFRNNGQFLRKVSNEISNSCYSSGINDREISLKTGLSLLYSSISEGKDLKPCFDSGSQSLKKLESKIVRLSDSFCGLAGDLKTLEAEKVRIDEFGENLKQIATHVSQAEEAKKAGNAAGVRKAIRKLEALKSKDCGNRVQLALADASLLADSLGQTPAIASVPEEVIVASAQGGDAEVIDENLDHSLTGVAVVSEPVQPDSRDGEAEISEPVVLASRATLARPEGAEVSEVKMLQPEALEVEPEAIEQVETIPDQGGEVATVDTKTEESPTELAVFPKQLKSDDKDSEAEPSEPVELASRASLARPEGSELSDGSTPQPEQIEVEPVISKQDKVALKEFRSSYQKAVRVCDFEKIDAVGDGLAGTSDNLILASLKTEYHLFKKLISVGRDKVSAIDSVLGTCNWDEADSLAKNIEQSLSRLSRPERRCAWRELGLDRVIARIASKTLPSSSGPKEKKLSSLEKELDSFSIDQPITPSRFRGITRSIKAVKNSIGLCYPALTEVAMALEVRAELMRLGKYKVQSAPGEIRVFTSGEAPSVPEEERDFSEGSVVSSSSKTSTVKVVNKPYIGPASPTVSSDQSPRRVGDNSRSKVPNSGSLSRRARKLVIEEIEKEAPDRNIHLSAEEEFL